MAVLVAFAITSGIYIAALPTLSGALESGSKVFYVAKAGSDSAAGTSAHPFRSIQYAVNHVRVGSTVLVRSGTFRGFEVRRDAITVASAPHAKVVISGGGDDTVQFTGVVGGGLRGVEVIGSDIQYGSAVKVTDSRGVSIRRSSAHGAKTFGIVIVDSRGVLLTRNNIFGNASGIEERRAEDLHIIGNSIHGNRKPVDSGRGKEGITFYKSTGRVVVKRNHFRGNRTHLEVYGASHLVISKNRFTRGQVMETGTSGEPCSHNRFVRNIATKGSGYSNGMILRCAKNMLIAHNVFDGFDDFGLYVVNGLKGVAYGGSIAGLTVVNNIIVRGRVYSLGAGLPSSVVVNHNLINNQGSHAEYGHHLAYVEGRGNAETLKQLSRWTGYDRAGVARAPRFVDRKRGDYHLRKPSPAIDAGVKLTGAYRGRAPDIGRYERS